MFPLASSNRLQAFRYQADQAYSNFQDWYHDLTPVGRRLVILYVILNILLIGTLLIVSPSRLFRALASWAIELRKSSLGPIYLIVLLSVASFPPVIGFGTLCTLCGFTYGWLWGWMVATTGCLCGSAVSFVALRHNLPRFQQWLSEKRSFAALRQAVGVKGLPLICLIRLCPFPFTYTNLFFASLTTSCTFSQFMIATAATTPKLLLHVFIGSRVFKLSAAAGLDRLTVILNIIYIICSVVLGASVSFYLYRVTMAEAGAISLEDDQRGPLLQNEESATPLPQQWEVEFEEFVVDEEDEDLNDPPPSVPLVRHGP
ncbi:hypothetical protein CROQUDRAFT_667510 [Cronartium quercuum f. sp. fusiforme G11]|uniref:Golgi apparatus membrane protein TVP38 n=1 Tax=Cronartium quercuum f. sp. fusiforme G11 TaxID=708437 RepID=A0A9P6THY6_9BASI|nr:hypothetical protein CROQUDRAFT_667510 [Cronartium quercuum f. sp. fusiforme G11]